MAAGAPILIVAGNIATGKTQLVKALGRALSLPHFLERWQENPWFDGDPRDIFAAQMWFLLAASADHARMVASGGIQERCIHEHAHVFAREQLAGEDMQLLAKVYSRLDAMLPDPDLLIYLEAPVPALCERVRNRKRAQELSLTASLLQRLQSGYEELLSSWTRSPIIEIDTEAVDLRTAKGIRHVLELVSEKIS